MNRTRVNVFIVAGPIFKFLMFFCSILQCTIHRNGNGVQSVQLTDLTVIEKLKFAPPPTSKMGLEIGSPRKIHCKAQGTPTPQIQWSKVSQTIAIPFYIVQRETNGHKRTFLVYSQLFFKNRYQAAIYRTQWKM